MKTITAEDVRKLREETGEGMMAYTQERYAELENRCKGWRKFAINTSRLSVSLSIKLFAWRLHNILTLMMLEKKKLRA